MADLASSVKAMDGAGTLTRLTRKEKIGRHDNFKHIPTYLSAPSSASGSQDPRTIPAPGL